MYIEQLLPIRAIAKACDCSLRTAARWISIHGIKTRDPKLAKRLNPKIGPANPQYKGCSICPKCGGRKTSDSTVKTCVECRTRKGIENPNWKGIANIMTGVRSWTGSVWRNAVFFRDNYTCQRCGDKQGGNLHAHHTTRLSVLVQRVISDMNLNINADATQRNAIISQILNDPRIASIDGGTTLCETCHRHTHKGKTQDEYHIHST